MKAAQFNKYGGPEVIEINTNAARPVPKEGQVLVEVHAAALNPVDVAVRAGYMQKMVPITFPATLAGDFAGVVKELGKGVSDLTVGDEVFGMAPVIAGGSGAVAEYAAANAAMTARKPAKTTYSEAAALVLVGVSAVQALEEHMKAAQGQKVLIHGGAGGIGSIAIQYAKHLGCYVATTVRGAHKEFARNLGGDRIINFEEEEFENILKDYDAVLDTVGGEVYKKSFGVVKRGGIVVSMIYSPSDQELMSKYGVRSVTQSTQVSTASLTHLSELVDRGVIKSYIDSEFPLEGACEGYSRFEQGHPQGKIVFKLE